MRLLVAVIVAALVVGAAIALTTGAEQIFEYSGPAAVTLFFLVIVTEVVLAPVPGGIISFLGSAHFGFWVAWPVLYAGNLVGSSLAFGLAHRHGRPIIERMTSERDRERYDRIVRGHRAILWLVYMLPIFPIDVISFLCGFSTLRYRVWLPIMATGMLVYTLVVSSVGAYFGQFIPWLGRLSLLATLAFVVLVAWFVWSLRRSRSVPE